METSKCQCDLQTRRKTTAGQLQVHQFNVCTRKIDGNIIRDATVQYMEQNNLFSPRLSNPASRKLLDISSALNDGVDVDVSYIDLKRAFDKIPQQRLLVKLWGYEI